MPSLGSGRRLVVSAWLPPTLLTALLVGQAAGPGQAPAGLAMCALVFLLVLLVKAAPMSVPTAVLLLTAAVVHGAVSGATAGTRAWWAAWTAWAAYVLVLTSWQLARRAEARDGLVPAVGVTGTAVWRRQADPTTTVLPATTTRAHSNAAVTHVVLHGLGATAGSLQGLADALAGHGRSTLAPDLLGHGRSRGIGTQFGLTEQADAVVRLLDAQGLTCLTLVGHSYGCAVAAEAATSRPDLFADVVLVCPPVFPDEAKARARLSERSWLARQTLRGRRSASLVCGVMCLARVPLARLAPRFAPQLPRAAAAAGVDHTYPAYRDALIGLFSPRLRNWLADPPVRTTVLLGRDDQTEPLETFCALKHDRVTVVVLPGDHLMPLTDPTPVADAIEATTEG